MPVLLTSPAAITDEGSLREDVVLSLRRIHEGGTPVVVVSNHEEPPWFESTLGLSGVHFFQERGRQGGEFVRKLAKHLGVSPWDILVLAGPRDDVQMAKNGGAVLAGAGWCDAYVGSLGIEVRTPEDLELLVSLSRDWPGGWWYRGEAAGYSVCALSDLSTMYAGAEQERFGRVVTRTVKEGGAKLHALLSVASRSLLASGFDETTMWGVYPSSSSDNRDEEVLSDFVHRLRTTVSRVRMARRGEPLFIRHRASPARHKGGVDREDPSGQIETIHINPVYKGRVAGRKVVVVDDCTTYGVSFAVAAGFLRAAGASSVTGVALGKFGNRVGGYDIDITSSPFAPVASGDYSWSGPNELDSSGTDGTAQAALRTLIT